MNELEELRKKRMAQLLEQQQNAALREEFALQQQIAQLEMIVRRIMTSDALTRYGNIKVAHPEKAVQVLAVFGQLMQKRNIQQIDDQMLKEVLASLTMPKREINIRRI